MAKVIMTCGKICCGKTTYAKKLRDATNTVILSLDEVMLTMFPDGAAEMHDEYAYRAEQYLLNLSIQVLATGVDVIFDWGLWTKAQRKRMRSFYDERKVEYEVHYLKVDNDEWNRRIERRNRENPAGTYFVDEGLISKVNRLFQEPIEDEIDVMVIEG